MAAPKFKLTRRSGGYFTVVADGAGIGYCAAAPNPFAAPGHAGWNFTPNSTGAALGLPARWETTPKRAVAAAFRARDEAAA